MEEFNKIMKLVSVDQYQERFEGLTSYMTTINPLLNDTHIVSIYISGLKPELKPLLANPSTIMDVYENAKLYEEFLQPLLHSFPQNLFITYLTQDP